MDAPRGNNDSDGSAPSLATTVGGFSVRTTTFKLIQYKESRDIRYACGYKDPYMEVVQGNYVSIIGL